MRDPTGSARSPGVLLLFFEVLVSCVLLITARHPGHTDPDTAAKGEPPWSVILRP